MSERSSPGSGPAVADGLDVHLAAFLATLKAAGYSSWNPTSHAAPTRHNPGRGIIWPSDFSEA